MSSLIYRRTSCRLCGDVDLELVLALNPTPLANAFVDKTKVSTVDPLFPIDVHQCNGCSHVQLLDIIEPNTLFADYVYASGTVPVLVEHFRQYAEEVMTRYDPSPGGLVIDIGSNDGTLLSFFQEHGMAVLGVDPAINIAEQASRDGIETIVGFFDNDTVERINQSKGKASVVTANNVFAHVDDLASIVEGVRFLLKSDGIFIFEVSYLADVIEKTLFDTIYHEHLSYHSVGPLQKFFSHRGMEMISASRIDTHGGSIRAVCQLAGGPRDNDGSVDKLIENERAAGLDQAETYNNFAEKIGKLGLELNNFLAELKSGGKVIAGYGAPAKSTTLMHQFGIGPETVDFVVDDSPLKQHLYTPGFHIPVVTSDVIYDKRPDYLIILAWNFADSIIENHRRFKSGGGQFIVPLPKLRIV